MANPIPYLTCDVCGGYCRQEWKGMCLSCRRKYGAVDLENVKAKEDVAKEIETEGDVRC